MTIRQEDKKWLFTHADEIGLELTLDQIKQFCDRVEAAVRRDDEPRWVAREFELKAIKGERL